MFSVGDRVECTLDTIPGGVGQWTVYYPGTVVELVNHTIYRVKLDNSEMVEKEAHDVKPLRTDRCPTHYVFSKDENIQVVVHEGKTEIWFNAKVIDPERDEEGKIYVSWVYMDGTRSIKSRVSVDKIRLNSFHCSVCEEKQPNGKRGFCSSSECAHCYVESKVDGLLDVMDEREKYTKRCKPEVYYSGEYSKVRNDVLTRRMWILQTGGTTQRRDERLHNQLVEAFEKMDQLLEEHPDEQEY